MTPDSQNQERRGYIRMDTVLPVRFRLTGPDGKTFLSDWQQGFTRDVGKGGLCLEVNTANALTAELMRNKDVRVVLDIELPRVAGATVAAQASVAWFQDIEKEGAKCLVGLQYDAIDAESKGRIMRYARAKQMFLPAVTAVIIVLGAILAFNSYINFRLILGNKMLVGQLIKVMQDKGAAQEQLKQITKETKIAQLKIMDLASRIKSVEEEKSTLQENMAQEKSAAAKQLEEYNLKIERLSKEKGLLQQQVASSRTKESAVTQELERLDKDKFTLTQANFHKMYKWLAIHQNPRTGLVMSFEGDANVADQAFVYDQSLAVQVFAYMGDTELCRRALDFFSNKAKRENGLFFNSYYFDDGNPAEYVIHSGPNIWLGIAALQYAHTTKDRRYVPLAEEIGRTIMLLQAQDKEGGIRGGPSVSWYATEHNLDAYAFFKMLFTVTHNPVYAEAGDKVFKWLLRHSYDKSNVPIIRGKGDSTIATDTYAWSIAAIGPEKLKDAGLDPDKIIEFAETQCMVSVSYSRPDGETVIIKGFDFAPQRHVARGGVISAEWTAQMITAFKIMSDYYRGKNDPVMSGMYMSKAEEFLGYMCNMIICSPSPTGQGEGCLPYASADFVDTGHGWMTPKGKTTGSVAGTAYAFFAYYGYNPLDLK